MADLLIKDVDEKLVERLEHQASKRGLSLDAFLRGELVQMAPPARQDVLARIDQIRARSKPWTSGDPTSVDYIREGRSERDAIKP